MAYPIDNQVDLINKQIGKIEKELAKLNRRKENLLNIKQAIPDAHYENGAISSPSVNDMVTCLKLESRWDGLYAKFHINPKTYGRPIYSLPYENKIASYNYDQIERQHKTIIHDYESIISDKVKSKKKFVKRIKIFLIKEIQRKKQTLSDDSYNVGYFKKLLLLS